MAEKNNANIGFEKQIWDAACVLWGHIPAAEYRKVIIGLIFLRYISSAFERKYNELVAEGEGFEEDRDEYLGENIFFVPEKARWSTVAAAAHTPEIGTVLDEAMREIEAENKSLKNVLPKNYASPDLDKRVLGDVVDPHLGRIVGDESHCHALPLGPAGTADPVDIVLIFIGNVAVEHDVHIIHVDATGRHIGGHQHPDFPRLEAGQGILAGSLRFVSMDGGRGDACPVQIPAHLVRSVLGAGKH